MEIAVVVLAIVALGGFVGWLWAQRSAGLAREQVDERALRRRRRRTG